MGNKFNYVVMHFKALILNDMKKAGIICWVAGGAVRDKIIGEAHNDIDLYFPDQNNYDKAVRYLIAYGGVTGFESASARKVVWKGNEYHLIKIFKPNPKATINRFDYSVCAVAVDHERFYGSTESVIDILTKNLVVGTNLSNPVDTLWRATKFCSRGFKINKPEFNKILKQINIKDKDQVNELEDYEDNEDERDSHTSTSKNPLRSKKSDSF